MTAISALPAVTPPLTGAELLALVQAGVTDKVTAAQVAALGELYAALHLGAAPDRSDAAATYFTTQAAGEPVVTWFPPTVTTVANFGYAMSSTGGLRLFSRGVVGLGIDRMYEVEAVVEQVSVGGGESPVCRVGMTSLKSDYTSTSGSPDAVGPASAILTAGQIISMRYRFGVTKPYGGLANADISTASFSRPFVDFNLKSDLSGPTSSSVARVRRLLVRDVTAQVTGEQGGRRRRRFFIGDL